eukprot:1018269-Prorocentrum_lima.AAC.1
MLLVPVAGGVSVGSSIVCVAVALLGSGGGGGGGGIVCVVAFLCTVWMYGARVGAIFVGGRRASVRDRARSRLGLGCCSDATCSSIA